MTNILAMMKRHCWPTTPHSPTHNHLGFLPVPVCGDHGSWPPPETFPTPLAFWGQGTRCRRFSGGFPCRPSLPSRWMSSCTHTNTDSEDNVSSHGSSGCICLPRDWRNEHFCPENGDKYVSDNDIWNTDRHTGCFVQDELELHSWKLWGLTLWILSALILPVCLTCGPRHKSINGPHLQFRTVASWTGQELHLQYSQKTTAIGGLTCKRWWLGWWPSRSGCGTWTCCTAKRTMTCFTSAAWTVKVWHQHFTWSFWIPWTSPATSPSWFPVSQTAVSPSWFSCTGSPGRESHCWRRPCEERAPTPAWRQCCVNI